MGAFREQEYLASENKMKVAFACQFLTQLGVFFDRSEDGYWDVCTSTGWKSASTPNELLQIVFDERKERERDLNEEGE